MTTPEAILLDLSIGRSTSESIGKRLRVPMLTIDAMIHRHITAGLVERVEHDGDLVVWTLTTAGHEQCPPPAPTVSPGASPKSAASSSANHETRTCHHL